MQKLLERVGIALCAIGLLLGTVAITAHFSPPGDPTGAAGSYDESVDANNERVSEIEKSNPGLPATAKGKTVLQAHKEATLFWILVAGVITLVGIALSWKSRARLR